MRKRVVTRGLGLVGFVLSALAAANCGAAPCTQCPNIAGAWTLTAKSLGPFSASNAACQWDLQQGATYALSVFQPDGGASVTLQVINPANLFSGVLNFSGTIGDDDTVSASETQSSSGLSTTNSLGLTFSGTTAFTGNWIQSNTMTGTGTSTYCSGTAQIEGSR